VKILIINIIKMTLQEAIEELKNGATIKHKLFKDYEWVRMDKGGDVHYYTREDRKYKLPACTMDLIEFIDTVESQFLDNGEDAWSVIENKGFISRWQ